MTISHLLDHTARIWRKATELGRTRVEKRSYAVVDTVPCAVRRPRARGARLGVGVAPVGERVVYMATGVDVAFRDILELTAGPDAGALLEVDDDPTTPRGDHIELQCRRWEGKLPEVDS